jgi:CubicO group peptidase (beta-lactamase class C family)
VTFGYLLGEVIRRVSGRMVGALLRSGFTGDAWIGLPSDLAGRVVPYVEAAQSPDVQAASHAMFGSLDEVALAALNHQPLSVEVFNDPGMWTPELPAVNGVFAARALSSLYARAIDGHRLSPETIDAMRRVRSDGPDRVLVDQPTRFGTVFMLASPREPMLGPGSFGHNGMGGALAFAHPESGISFAYLPNRAIAEPTPHRRVHRLLAAVAAAV